MQRRPANLSRTRGFTMIEVIVVVAILAILGTIILPRLAGNPEREFRFTVDKVADLLTMYGQRQNLGQSVVGITLDRDAGAISLIGIDAGEGSSQWYYDQYVKPVELPGFMTANDLEFIVDGDRFDPGEWPIASEPGQQRPTIEVHLRGPESVATVILQPHGVAPIIIHGNNSSGIGRSGVDLDGEGRGREDW